MSWNGPSGDRKTYRWSHVCVSVRIAEDRAEREFSVDGEHHANFTSDTFSTSLWPKGHNFTFGGREIYYYGPHLHGFIADVQIFSRQLPKEEMIGYTTCGQVVPTKKPRLRVNNLFSRFYEGKLQVGMKQNFGSPQEMLKRQV